MSGIAGASELPWIEVVPGVPYFQEENGNSWHPIGHNDSVDWPELAPLFRRKDPESVERHLHWLKAHGVTCLRLMLEDARGLHRFIERPAGRFVPNMVQFWDDLFLLCEKVGLRVLLTPLDTFWMWMRWDRHPWNGANGGTVSSMREALLDPEMRAALKHRLEFAVRRWSGSGALFAWDLWNEIHPANAQGSADCFGEVIDDLSHHIRTLERQLYGRTHLQTVSLFGPELRWQPHLPLREPIFRHPSLDFATLHIYRERSIDAPRNTVAPARAMGEVVRESIAEIEDARPFLDTEHGPIHSFKDRRITLPEPFDDEYFRHIAWAHLASGGAGGGMRWPNRHPHVLTPGMRRAQKAMNDFLPLIDWQCFRRRNLNEEARAPGCHTFACADDRQGVVWLLRSRCLAADGTMRRDLPTRPVTLHLPFKPAKALVTEWDTQSGTIFRRSEAQTRNGILRYRTGPMGADRAFAIVSG